MSELLRLNLGCGAFSLPRSPHDPTPWVNIDADPHAPADLYVTVPPLPFPDESCAELYAGHLLEHLTRDAAAHLLRECRRVLVPGGRLGVVVPDTRAVLERYLAQNGTWVEIPQGRHWCLNDLDAVCAVFLYSTIQDSPHRWSYDAQTLRRLLEAHDFVVAGEIDRWHDPRASSWNWWSCGLDCYKPPAPAGVVMEPVS